MRIGLTTYGPSTPIETMELTPQQLQQFCDTVGITVAQYHAMCEPPPPPDLTVEPVTDDQLALLGIDPAWFAAMMR